MTAIRETLTQETLTQEELIKRLTIARFVIVTEEDGWLRSLAINQVVFLETLLQINR